MRHASSLPAACRANLAFYARIWSRLRFAHGCSAWTCRATLLRKSRSTVCTSSRAVRRSSCSTLRACGTRSAPPPLRPSEARPARLRWLQQLRRALQQPRATTRQPRAPSAARRARRAREGPLKRRSWRSRLPFQRPRRWMRWRGSRKRWHRGSCLLTWQCLRPWRPRERPPIRAGLAKRSGRGGAAETLRGLRGRRGRPDLAQSACHHTAHRRASSPPIVRISNASDARSSQEPGGPTRESAVLRCRVRALRPRVSRVAGSCARASRSRAVPSAPWRCGAPVSQLEALRRGSLVRPPPPAPRRAPGPPWRRRPPRCVARWPRKVPARSGSRRHRCMPQPWPRRRRTPPPQTPHSVTRWRTRRRRSTRRRRR